MKTLQSSDLSLMIFPLILHSSRFEDSCRPTYSLLWIVMKQPSSCQLKNLIQLICSFWPTKNLIASQRPTINPSDHGESLFRIISPQMRISPEKEEILVIDCHPSLRNFSSLWACQVTKSISRALSWCFEQWSQPKLTVVFCHLRWHQIQFQKASCIELLSQRDTNSSNSKIIKMKVRM